MASYRERIYRDYASNFQDNAPVFDVDFSRRWGRAYDHYFRQWLPEKKDAAILDVACGGGRLLHFLKERGYTNLSGVDISPSQVAIARQVVPGVIERDVLDFLDAQTGTFDLVTGIDIIEHFGKDEVLRFLDGCNKALKPGGRLILQTANADCPWGSSMRYHDFTHENSFTPNSLTRLLKLCGFENPESRESEPPLGYSLFSSIRWVLWQWLRLQMKAWNYIEIGTAGDGVFTRDLIISAVKRR